VKIFCMIKTLKRDRWNNNQKNENLNKQVGKALNRCVDYFVFWNKSRVTICNVISGKIIHPKRFGIHCNIWHCSSSASFLQWGIFGNSHSHSVTSSVNDDLYTWTFKVLKILFLFGKQNWNKHSILMALDSE
jgi:hypothetical protein